MNIRTTLRAVRFEPTGRRVARALSLLAIFLGAASATGACAEQPAATAPPAADLGSTTALPADFCERFLEKRCHDQEACGRSFPAIHSLCVDTEMPSCRRWANDLTAAMLRGEVTFRPPVYAELLASPASATCEEGQSDKLVAEAFVGAVRTGELCFAPAGGDFLRLNPCMSGLQCETPRGTCGPPQCLRYRVQSEGCVGAPDSCGPGLVCQGTFCNGPRVGQPCDPDVGCPTGTEGPLRCEPSEDGHRCERFRTIGAKCASVADCDSGACGGGLCVKARALGDTCDPASAECGPGARCDLNSAGAFACARDPGYLDACTTDADCLNSARRLFCVAGRCDLGPGVGSECDDGACAFGAHCAGTTCFGPSIDGSCGDSDECPRDFHCGSKSFRCAPNVRVIGAACDREDNESCEPGLRCSVDAETDLATCQRAGLLGEPCADSSTCGQGLVCVSKRCAKGC